MARTVRIKIYKFSELNSEAKSKVIKDNCDINTHYEWNEYIKENFKENKEFFDVTNVYYSGFYSQGDGAMFEYQNINRDFIKSIIDGLKLPKWKINVLNSCLDYTAIGTHSGNYYHNKSVDHNINIESIHYYLDYPNIADFIELHSYEIIEIIKDKYEILCDELYNEYKNEYSYLTSDECIKDTIESNNYEFTINGNRF